MKRGGLRERVSMVSVEWGEVAYMRASALLYHMDPTVSPIGLRLGRPLDSWTPGTWPWRSQAAARKGGHACHATFWMEVPLFILLGVTVWSCWNG